MAIVTLIFSSTNNHEANPFPYVCRVMLPDSLDGGSPS